MRVGVANRARRTRGDRRGGRSAGDAYAIGVLWSPQEITHELAVVRLDGASGAVRWRAELAVRPPLLDAGFELLLGPDGNPVAVGVVDDGPVPQIAVVKLDAATGAIIWRRDLGSPSATWMPAARLGIDQNGDVVVATAIAGVGDTDFAVVKLDGANGDETWRYVRDGAAGTLGTEAEETLSVALAGTDVIAATLLKVAGHDEAIIVRLDGATGAELWQVPVPAVGSESVRSMAVASQASGDVLALAGIFDAHSRIVVRRLDGATGGEVWGQTVDFAAASTLAVAADGDAFIGSTPFVRRLDAADGAEDLGDRGEPAAVHPGISRSTRTVR